VGVTVAVGVAAGVAVTVAVAVPVAVLDGVAVAVGDAVAVVLAVAVLVAVMVGDAVTVAMAVAVRVIVAVADAVGNPGALAVGVAVPVRVAVAVIDAVRVGVEVAETVGAGVGVEPGDPSPDSSNIPRPWVAAKTTPLRFCSISKTATAGIVPRLNGAHVFPPSVVLKMPMSVAASTVFAVGSLRSISNRSTGTSRSAFAGGGLWRVGLPSACVHEPPKSMVTKTWPIPVADVKPERLR